MAKEIKVKKIVVYKERDYKEYIGELQFWEESDENLFTTFSTGNTWDFTERTQGLYLGSLKFHSKNVTPKMAKQIAAIIKKSLSEANPKVKTVEHPN